MKLSRNGYLNGTLIASLFAAAALLLTGYALAGLWLVVPALLAAMLIGWFIWSARSLLSALLVIYVGAAAGGVLSGASPWIVIAGCAAMLFGWEWAEQLERQDGGLPERSHAILLIASVGIGGLVAEAGLWIHPPIPFGGILLAGLLALFGLYRFFRSVSR